MKKIIVLLIITICFMSSSVLALDDVPACTCSLDDEQGSSEIRDINNDDLLANIEWKVELVDGVYEYTYYVQNAGTHTITDIILPTNGGLEEVFIDDCSNPEDISVFVTSGGTVKIGRAHV